MSTSNFSGAEIVVAFTGGLLCGAAIGFKGIAIIYIGAATYMYREELGYYFDNGLRKIKSLTEKKIEV